MREATIPCKTAWKFVRMPFQPSSRGNAKKAILAIDVKKIDEAYTKFP